MSRAGFKANMLALGAHPDAVDHLQGHKLGRGSRDRYIDVWLALPLAEIVDLVPKLGAERAIIRLQERDAHRR